MDLRPGQRTAQAKILAIDHLGFRGAALLQQQRTERVADRLHPAPGLVVGQGVLQRDGGAQAGESSVVLAAAIGDLARQHLLGDREQLHAGDIVKVAGVRHEFRGRAELPLFRLRRGHVAERGVRHALGVVHHRRGVAVESAVLRQVLRDDLAPFAEADEDVLSDGDIALEELGHGRRGDAQHLLRHGLDQLVGGGERGRVLAVEHRAVGREVIVVHAIARVEIHRAGAVVELAVRDDRLLVPVHGIAVVAALHVDVGRHVDEVAHVGAELAQPVAGHQRRLRTRRHLHQVDVKVQKAGMAHRAGQIAEAGLEQVARLERAGGGCGLAGARVPHAPGCPVEDRFHEDGAQIEVIGMRPMREPHGVGEGIVPGALVVDGLALWVARGQRLDQRALRRGDAVYEREGVARGVIGTGERLGFAGGVLQLPGEVVVRPDRVGDAPMGHRTFRIDRQRLLEAGDRFLMVKAKAPVEAAVEPALGLRRFDGHLAGVGAEIIRIVHGAPFAISRSLGHFKYTTAATRVPAGARADLTQS